MGKGEGETGKRRLILSVFRGRKRQRARKTEARWLGDGLNCVRRHFRSAVFATGNVELVRNAEKAYVSPPCQLSHLLCVLRGVTVVPHEW